MLLPAITTPLRISGFCMSYCWQSSRVLTLSLYPTPPPSRSPPSRCCESLWCHRALLIPFCAPLTDGLWWLSWTKPTMPHSGLFLIEATGRCFPENPTSELYWEKRSRSPLVFKEEVWSFKPFQKRRTCNFSKIRCYETLITTTIGVNRWKGYRVCLGDLSLESIWFWLCETVFYMSVYSILIAAWNCFHISRR